MSEAELHLVIQIPKGILVPDLTGGQPTEGMPVQLNLTLKLIISPNTLVND